MAFYPKISSVSPLSENSKVSSPVKIQASIAVSFGNRLMSAISYSGQTIATKITTFLTSTQNSVKSSREPESISPCFDLMCGCGCSEESAWQTQQRTSVNMLLPTNPRFLSGLVDRITAQVPPRLSENIERAQAQVVPVLEQILPAQLSVPEARAEESAALPQFLVAPLPSPVLEERPQATLPQSPTEEPPIPMPEERPQVPPTLPQSPAPEERPQVPPALAQSPAPEERLQLEATLPRSPVLSEDEAVQPVPETPRSTAATPVLARRNRLTVQFRRNPPQKGRFYRPPGGMFF